MPHRSRLAAGWARARLAEELGYASAAVVDQTRSRLYQRLREEFEGQATTSLFGMVTGE
jgi:hypothetical protein